MRYGRRLFLRAWPLLTGALMVALVASLLRHIDFATVAQSLHAAARLPLAAAFLLAISSMFIRAARFAVLVRQPLLSVFSLQAYAQLLGMMTPASVGESVKAIAMHKRFRLQPLLSVRILIFERALELCVLCLLAAPTAYTLLSPTLKGSPLSTGGLLGALLACAVGGLAAGKKFRGAFQRVCSGLSPLALFQSLCLSALLWILEGGVLFLCVYSVAPLAPNIAMFCIVPFSILVGALSGLPAGIGSFDLSITSLLQPLEVETVHIVAGLIFYRLASTVLPTVVTLPLVVVQRRIMGQGDSSTRSDPYLSHD